MGLFLMMAPFLLLVDILRRAPFRRWGLRESFLVASVVFGGLLAAATEILGFLGALSAPSVSGFWLAVCIALLPVWLRRRFPGGEGSGVADFFRDLSWGEKLLLGLTLAFVLVTGVIAFVAPPNTWDSMTYHMSRVMHWIQNRSVDHYPTGIGRQLFINPFAEYAILHFQLLTGTDRFANHVQWFSFVGSIAGVSLIARLLGADRRGQIFAMAVAASIPMAILQSTSTQTDLVVAFWGVCCVAFFLRWRNTQGWPEWVGVSVGAGLVVLTKTTGLFALAPFGVWALVEGFRRQGVRFLAPVAVSGLAVLLFMAPFLARNHKSYGNPLGAGDVVAETNHLDAGARTAVSSVVLNLGLHFGTASEKVNRFLEKRVRDIHGMLDVPVPKRFSVCLSTSEDYAGNFRHLLLFLAMALVFPVLRNRSPVLWLYAACLVLGFVFQSVALGWSPWRSRYHTILFVLAAPWIACAARGVRYRRLCLAGLVVLVLTSVPWLLDNSMKPVFGRKNVFARPRLLQYFDLRRDLFKAYVQAAELIQARSVRSVGLVIGTDSWEYPFWVLLDPLRSGIRMEHIRLDDGIRASAFPVTSFLPEAILASAPGSQPERMVHNGIVFVRAMQDRGVAVFLREAAPGPAAAEPE